MVNTGRRSGDEVVQLYVRDDEASVTRPVLELKRFQRVTLAPGERRTVTFELRAGRSGALEHGDEAGGGARHLHHLGGAELGGAEEREADGRGALTAYFRQRPSSIAAWLVLGGSFSPRAAARPSRPCGGAGSDGSIASR